MLSVAKPVKGWVDRALGRHDAFIPVVEKAGRIRFLEQGLRGYVLGHGGVWRHSVADRVR